MLILLLWRPLGITPASALRVNPRLLRAYPWAELQIAALSLLLALCKNSLLNHLPADAFFDFLLLPLASLDGAYQAGGWSLL